MGFLGIKSKQEREQALEIQFRRARKALTTYIQKCNELKTQYFDHGRRAAALGDEGLRRQFASGYVNLHDQIQRAERMLLLMDGVKLRQEAVRTAGQFVEFTSQASRQLLGGISDAEVDKMQAELQRAAGRAETLDKALTGTLGVISDKIVASPDAAADAVSETEKLFQADAPADAAQQERVKQVERAMGAKR